MTLNILSIATILLVFALGLSVLVYHGITGVPPVPTKPSEAADVIALFQQASIPDGGTIYELGCGWGTLAILLAKTFPNARIKGIEWSPLPYWVAKFRTRKYPNIHLQRGNLFNFDLRDANGVTCYLMMKTMVRLAPFLDRMLQPGTPVVTVTFWFRGRQTTAIRKGRGLRGQIALYYWPALPEPTHPETFKNVVSAPRLSQEVNL